MTPRLAQRVLHRPALISIVGGRVVSVQPAVSLQPTWLLLALLPLGAMLWWAVQSMREISAMQRDNDEALADLLRRFPWLEDDSGQDSSSN